MKKVIKYILLTIIVLAAAYFYSYVKKTGDVKPGNIIECNGISISAVKIGFEISDAAEGEVTVGIVDENGTEIRHKTKNVSELSKEGYTSFTFDKIKDCKNKTYTVQIKTDTDKVKLKENATMKYNYVGFRLETMIVFVICIAYLVGLSKTLSFIFRK